MLEDQAAVTERVTRRLYLLRGFPKRLPDAAKELVIAAQNADSLEILEKVLTDFSQYGNSHCPTAAELRAAIYRENESRSPEPSIKEPKDKPCQKCRWMGYYLGDDGVYQRCEACPNGREFSDVLLNMLNSPRVKDPKREQMKEVRTREENRERLAHIAKGYRVPDDEYAGEF